MRPILIRIPFIDLPIFAYGFMIMIGFLLAIYYAARQAKKQGIDPNRIIDLGMLCVFAGVVGSRVFYVVQYWEKFANREWWRVFAIWEGGIVFFGGLIGGIIATIWYVRRHNLPLLNSLDLLAPAVPIGLSFGRIGCFLNGCCWGKYTEGGCQFPAVQALTEGTPSPAFLQHTGADWARLNGLTPLTPGSAEWSYPIHPTQLYSWAAALALFAVLHILYQRRTREGQAFCLLLTMYPLQRFIIETFRGDHESFFSFPAAIAGIFSNTMPAARLSIYQFAELYPEGGWLYRTYLTAAQNMAVIVVPLAIGGLVWLHLYGRRVEHGRRVEGSPTGPGETPDFSASAE